MQKYTLLSDLFNDSAKKLIKLILILMTGFRGEERLKILALGDSITQGGKRDREEYSYRLPLQMILHREKIPYDFIGSRSSGLHKEAQWPDVAEGVSFDPHHEGYYGNSTANLFAQV